MATRSLLTELAGLVEERPDVAASVGRLADDGDLADDGQVRVVVEAGGGVAVARQVREGLATDVVVLADDAMAALAADGFVDGATLRPLLISEAVVAVRRSDANGPHDAGAAPPEHGQADPDADRSVGRGADLSTEAGARATFATVARVGYSTGPSGTALLALLERWGLDLGDRLVQAPPGVPVGRLLAEGAVDLAVQQRSELSGIPGVVVLGELPEGARITSTFTAGVARTSDHAEVARAVIAALADPAYAQVIERHGLRRPD